MRGALLLVAAVLLPGCATSDARIASGPCARDAPVALDVAHDPSDPDTLRVRLLGPDGDLVALHVGHAAPNPGIVVIGAQNVTDEEVRAVVLAAGAPRNVTVWSAWKERVPDDERAAYCDVLAALAPRVAGDHRVACDGGNWTLVALRPAPVVANVLCGGSPDPRVERAASALRGAMDELARRAQQRMARHFVPIEPAGSG